MSRRGDTVVILPITEDRGIAVGPPRFEVRSSDDDAQTTITVSCDTWPAIKKDRRWVIEHGPATEGEE